MVKDLRTGHETGNTQAVLDGDLDAFMQAELERLATGGEPAGARARRRATRTVTTTVDQRDASAASRRATATGHGIRPATGRRPRDLRRDLARVASTTTSAGSPSPRSPTTSGRSSASTPTSTRPTRRPSSSPSGPTPDGRRRAIDAFVVGRPARIGCGSCRCCSSGPARRARGLGRALLAGDRRPEAAGPAGRRWSGRPATDSAQPISNGLYASLGIVPADPAPAARRPAGRRDALRPLPDGIEAIAFDEVGDGADGLGRSALAAELARSIATLPASSRPRGPRVPRREGRIGFLFRDRTARPIGYGYSSEAGRVGPIAVRDAALARRRSSAISSARSEPRGAFGLWVPGSAGEAIVPLLRAGFRLDGFPVLLCWDRPVRRLHPLHADLAGTALGRGRDRPRSPRPADGSLATDVAPPSCPRMESR